MEPVISTNSDPLKMSKERIFSKKVSVIDPSKPLPSPPLEAALQFVCKNTARLLDFSCGNGALALRAGLLGVGEIHGIEASEAAITQAKKQASQLNIGAKCKFVQGNKEELRRFKNATFDAIILTNVLDSLYPEEGNDLLAEIFRVVALNGKILLKLRCAQSTKNMLAQGYTQIDDEVFEAQDGEILWRISDATVQKLVDSFSFKIYTSTTMETQEGEKNRIFILTSNTSPK